MKKIGVAVKIAFVILLLSGVQTAALAAADDNFDIESVITRPEAMIMDNTGFDKCVAAGAVDKNSPVYKEAVSLYKTSYDYASCKAMEKKDLAQCNGIKAIRVRPEEDFDKITEKLSALSDEVPLLTAYMGKGAACLAPYKKSLDTLFPLAKDKDSTIGLADFIEIYRGKISSAKGYATTELEGMNSAIAGFEKYAVFRCKTSNEMVDFLSKIKDGKQDCKDVVNKSCESTNKIRTEAGMESNEVCSETVSLICDAVVARNKDLCDRFWRDESKVGFCKDFFYDEYISPTRNAFEANILYYFLWNKDMGFQELARKAAKDGEVQKTIGPDFTKLLTLASGESSCDASIDKAVLPYYCYQTTNQSLLKAIDEVATATVACRKTEPAKVTITNAESKKFELPVEVFIRKDELSNGLKGRKELPANTGALFMYNKYIEIASLQVIGVAFSLDAIFIDKTGVITQVAGSLNEDNAGSVKMDVQFEYILYVNAGFCEKNGIKEGDKVNVPY